MKKPTSNELEVMVDLIHATYKQIKFSDYKSIAEHISNDFEVEVNAQDIYNYYEGVYKQEQEDTLLTMKNAGIEY